jgi:hypothetical protein
VRTPPGKKSTSPRFGDIPDGTSEGSSSVIQVPNVLSGKGAKVSMLIVSLAEMATKKRGCGKVGD